MVVREGLRLFAKGVLLKPIKFMSSGIFTFNLFNMCNTLSDKVSVVERSAFGADALFNSRLILLSSSSSMLSLGLE